MNLSRERQDTFSEEEMPTKLSILKNGSMNSIDHLLSSYSVEQQVEANTNTLEIHKTYHQRISY